MAEYTREDVKKILGPLAGPTTPCAICGDTEEGQAHRVIDAVWERIQAGEGPVITFHDYGVITHDEVPVSG